jgi:hypothetical protein
MNPIINFNNINAQTLYTIANTSTVGSLKHTTDIKNILLPLIKNVINDSEAYSEARTKWDAFNYSVVTHVEKEIKEFIRMDYEESMCFSLFMYIYH